MGTCFSRVCSSLIWEIIAWKIVFQSCSLEPWGSAVGASRTDTVETEEPQSSSAHQPEQVYFCDFWFCFSALISWYGIRFVQNRSSDQSFENHRTRLTRHSKVISIVNILWVHYYFEEKYVIQYNIEIITSLSFLDSIYYYFVSGFPAYTIVSSTDISHFVFKRMRYTFIFEAAFF